MDSDFQQQQYQHHFQDLQRQFHHQKQQVNNLTRYRSAPSSYFASFLDAADSITSAAGGAGGGDRDDFSNARDDFSSVRPLSPETENIFARFMSSMDGSRNNTSSSSQKLSDIPEHSQMQPDFMVRVKQESDTLQQEQQQMVQQLQPQQQGHFNTSSSQVIYHSAAKPPLANQHSSGSAMISPKGSLFRGAAGSSLGMNSKPHMKIGIGGSSGTNNSSLTRHSSSPAGFFADLNIEGYGVLKGMGNYGGSSTGNDQVNYSSGQPSSTTGLMRQNSDMEGKLMRMNSLEETRFSNPGNNRNNDSNDGLRMTSWDDSIMSENFSGLDRREDDIKPFSDQNSSSSQSGESRSRLPMLAHHLSLPNTSAELAAMEKLLELDSVPLRIRAKRGCATHPRSIAERVRRTRISERMRKIQDLVPNMDKQTNTSDMLDLAVDYIKNLQKQVEALNDNRAKCTCSR